MAHPAAGKEAEKPQPATGTTMPTFLCVIHTKTRWRQKSVGPTGQGRRSPLFFF